jgi:transcriptional regulator with XRE-family HTH domain
MIFGDRLREMREAKQLSQGDIEKRTGLLRCYISRVENGHTVPAIETLEKIARALDSLSINSSTKAKSRLSFLIRSRDNRQMTSHGVAQAEKRDI